MTDCPHEHEQDTDLQTFKDIVRDEIDRTVLYGAYKDWCVFNRINPVSARRLYKSVWEIFRVDTHKLRDRRVFQGLKLVSENANSPQEVAGMAERWQD